MSQDLRGNRYGRAWLEQFGSAVMSHVVQVQVQVQVQGRLRIPKGMKDRAIEAGLHSLNGKA